MAADADLASRIRPAARPQLFDNANTGDQHHRLVEDDQSHDQAVEMLISDMRRRGARVTRPTDPLHDPQFIRQLISVYDLGEPLAYPAAGPGPREGRAAA